MLMLVISFSSNAGLITIDTSSDTIGVGDVVNVDILASDFVSTDTFSFFLDFDTTLFFYDEVSFDSSLYLSNPFAIFEVNVFDGYLAFSFLDFFAPIPTSDFVIASFSLTALQTGISPIALSSVEFYENGFFPISVNSTSHASIQAVDVPEPTTWVLFLLAVFVLMINRKRSFR
jgi:hypothetical protein